MNLNRYQRRKYRPALASQRRSHRVSWQVYLFVMLILLAVVYFRLLR